MSLRIGLKADNIIKYRVIGSTIKNTINPNELTEIDVEPDQSIEITSSNIVNNLTFRGDILSITISISELTSLNLGFAFLNALNNIDISSDVEITDFIDMLKKSKIETLTLNLLTIPNDLSEILNFTELGELNVNGVEKIFKNISDFRHSKVNDIKLRNTGSLLHLEDTTAFKDARLINFENTSNLENISGKEIEINPLLNVIRGRDSKIVPFRYEQEIDDTVDNNYNFEMDLSTNTKSTEMLRNYTELPNIDFNSDIDTNYNFEMDLSTDIKSTEMIRNYTELPTISYNSNIDSNYNFEMDLSTDIKSTEMIRNYTELPEISFDTTHDANYNFEMDIIRPYTEQD